MPKRGKWFGRGVLFFALVLLSACGGSSDDNKIANTSCGEENAGTDDIKFTSSGETQSFPVSEHSVYVTGSGNTVTVTTGSQVVTLGISGDNNMVTLENDVTVETLCFSGNDNTVNVPADSGISADQDSGFGNSVIEGN